MTLRERGVVSTQAMDLPGPWCSAALAVVLPTYNEASNLPVIVATLLGLPLPGLRSSWWTTIPRTAPGTWRTSSLGTTARPG